jgi:hypothetical protein
MAAKNSKVAAAKKLASKINSKKKTTKKSKLSSGQNAPQSSVYKKANDKKVEAKPVGYRWTDAGAKRLGKSATSKPTNADVEKYSGKTFKFKGEDTRYLYSEKRIDKSDVSKSAKLEEGGTLGAGSFKLGGGVGVKGRQYDPYNKKQDGEREAKPAGWRFTDRLAKRLGKSDTARPTLEQIERYKGKGVYYERRQDKADTKPQKKFLSFEDGGEMSGSNIEGAGMFKKGGGVGVKGRQYDPYNKKQDGEREAKPAGWRFTDRLAKRLGKSSTARPTLEQIEKYEGRGVYYERRQDKADTKPQKKYISLEQGGEMMGSDIQGAGMFAGGGGVHRVSNSESREYSENMMPFRANNLEGKTLSNGDYVVLSYGYYPIWYYSSKESKWYGNKDKYSQTTAKHISQSRPTYDAEMLGKSELLDKMMNQNATFENGGEINVLSANVATSPIETVGGTQFSTGDLTSNLTIDSLGY